VTLIEVLDLQAPQQGALERGNMDRVGFHVSLIDSFLAGRFVIGQQRLVDMRVTWRLLS
jgi:hypothetical protein